MTSSPVARIFLFLLIVLGVYLWIGYAITDLTGGGRKSSAAVDISPEGGEAIYWGKGRCFTCHSVGGQGSAVRGPNHGQFGEKFPLPMGARAAERAKERSDKEGAAFSAVDYIVESMASPGAYVVKGYKNEMAVVYAPPISLNLLEIKAVVAYLLSLGGDLDMEVIDAKPSEITQKFYAKIAAAAEAGGGDPGLGATVYDDNCSECHTLNGDGGEVGPNLTGISAKGLKFISEAILQPAKSMTKGFETYVAINKEGRQTVGLKTRDEAGEIDITKANGDVVTIARTDIKEIKIDDTKSVMPDDLSEAMTVKDYQDILSFLMLQKPKPKQ
ncbi:MAG: c-type cytochrome [Rhodospirillaceae bacterium]|jgi:putative heme-binding domain-containing protein|nr:c-type cytochrome [Rhodospirillaceae bacterium]